MAADTKEEYDMIKTYCGKSCEQCAEKMLGDCQGCTEGTENKKCEECAVAACSKERQHDSCMKCGERQSCVTYHSVMTKHAPMLGRWLTVLFWLIIPSIVASVMTSDSMVSLLPSIEIPGAILSIACALAYGLILLGLSSANEKYKISGILYLVSQAVAIFVLIVGGDATWAVFVSLAVTVIELLSEYNEIMAHSDVLEDIDDDLAVKWYKLWNLNMIMVCALVVGTILIFISAGLGAIVVLIASILAVVIEVLKLVYLYNTAKVFRKISARD